MSRPVAVVGVHGGEPYSRAARAAIAAADVVVGSARQLSATSHLRSPDAVTELIAGPLEPVLERIGGEADAGRAVCVVASGDPGFFGIVRSLGARLGADRLVVHPAPSSVALAFARLGLSWDDATVVSAHGRPLADAVASVRASGHPSVAVLTSPDNPAQAVASALLAAGEPDDAAAVASHLGDESESVTTSDLSAVAAGVFDPMSVLVITRAVGRQPGPALAWGLPEQQFDHRDGMITKAEVRAVALGKLAVPPSGVLWDVGAGSGSVGIECARLVPGLSVYAVERDLEQAARARANAGRHAVAVTVVEGEAPHALDALPSPDRVFIGGGGLDVLDAALGRLRPGGVAVATYAVMERAVAAASRLGNLVQVSVSRGVPTGALGMRLRSENPVFICWGPAA
jgi:precorrin-6Y C5,15-methyltransferase (decarboxylating)